MRVLVAAGVGALAVLGVAASVAHFLVEPYNPGFLDHPVITRSHVVLGGVYLALAPWQFVRRIRARALAYHRAAGRFLVTIGLVVGVTALFLGLVVPFSGNPERVVIGIFGGLFLTALLLGFRRVRQGRVAEHREWMLRAFAVGLSIATMRLIFIPSLAIVGDPTDQEVAMLSTGSFALSFLVHALAAELWIRRTRTGPVLPASGRPARSAAHAAPGS